MHLGKKIPAFLPYLKHTVIHIKTVPYSNSNGYGIWDSEFYWWFVSKGQKIKKRKSPQFKKIVIEFVIRNLSG